MLSDPDELLDLDVRALAAAFRAGETSPPAVARAALERIGRTDPHVHAWVSIDLEQVLAAAREAERELAAGIDRGPLHGVLIGVKDIFDVAGTPTRCGSAALADAPPAARDAAAVARMRDAGAVILGKTTTQEFAAGVVSAPARNPWDTARIPGGSSGGSAAAVALGHCRVALGSDTGGSIRIPAAACSVVGFKPMFGEIDARGVYPLASSLDTIGPLARSVDDTWIAWQLLRSADASPTLPSPLDPSSAKGLRVGVARSYFFDHLQPDVRKAVERTIALLAAQEFTIIDIEWPEAAAARAAAFIVNRVETAAVHERVALQEPRRFARYGPELRLRVAAGRLLPATLYLEAQRARQALWRSMRDLFREQHLDAVIAPTVPTTAVSAETLAIDETGVVESLGASWTRLTMPFNATGQPVLAVPAGFDHQGLPVGVQLAGLPGKEASLFTIGAAIERSAPCHSSPLPTMNEAVAN